MSCRRAVQTDLARESWLDLGAIVLALQPARSWTEPHAARSEVSKTRLMVTVRIEVPQTSLEGVPPGEPAGDGEVGAEPTRVMLT